MKHAQQEGAGNPGPALPVLVLCLSRGQLQQPAENKQQATHQPEQILDVQVISCPQTHPHAGVTYLASDLVCWVHGPPTVLRLLQLPPLLLLATATCCCCCLCFVPLLHV